MVVQPLLKEHHSQLTHPFALGHALCIPAAAKSDFKLEV